MSPWTVHPCTVHGWKVNLRGWKQKKKKKAETCILQTGRSKRGSKPHQRVRGETDLESREYYREKLREWEGKETHLVTAHVVTPPPQENHLANPSQPRQLSPVADPNGYSPTSLRWRETHLPAGCSIYPTQLRCSSLQSSQVFNLSFKT